jgi:hypothetical protein
MEQKESNKALLIIGLIAVVLLIIVFTTGFFVVQPIGAIPEGVTVWYFRSGLDLGFIESADGILLDSKGGVSLLGRMTVMGEVISLIEGRTIVKLPYLKFMYKISTGGVEFEQ